MTRATPARTAAQVPQLTGVPAQDLARASARCMPVSGRRGATGGLGGRW